MHYTNKKYSIKNFKKIYLMISANVSTGGPEALHQLGNILKNDLKKDIQIFYVPNNHNNPVHSNYKKYNLEFTNKIYDDPENLLIIPEHFMFLNYSLQFKKIKKIIWWLSLDNYFGFKFKNENHKFVRSFIKIPFNFISIFNKFTKYKYGILTLQDYLKFYYKFTNIKNHKEVNQASFHLMQSHYVYNFFKKKFKNIKTLFDYQNQNILNSSRDNN